MQLAKNLYLTPAKNMTRKGLEILIALKLDFDLSKERTLEIYLNVIEWGDGIYGAEAAARHYFHKSAAVLSSYEAAYLTAIIPNPVKWGRLPPGSYVRHRISAVLARMGDAPAPDLNKLPLSFSILPAVGSDKIIHETTQTTSAKTLKQKTQTEPPVTNMTKPVAPEPIQPDAAAPEANPAPDTGSDQTDPKEFFLDDL